MSSVLFKNTLKFDQKNCEKVEVLIVEHKHDDCLEIIAYNPILDQEAERIYVNYKLLKVKFDNSSPNSRLRIFESSKTTGLNSKVQTLNVAHYLTTRITVPVLINNCFVVRLVATEFDITQDFESKQLDIELNSKPIDLTPFKTQNMSSLSSDKEDGEVIPASPTTDSYDSPASVAHNKCRKSSFPVVHVDSVGEGVGINSIFSPRPEKVTMAATDGMAPINTTCDGKFNNTFSPTSTQHTVVRVGAVKLTVTNSPVEGVVAPSKLRRDRTRRRTFDVDNVENNEVMSLPPLDQMDISNHIKTHMVQSEGVELSGYCEQANFFLVGENRSASPTIDNVARRMSQVNGNMTMSALTAVNTYHNLLSPRGGLPPMLSRQSSDSTMDFNPPCLTPANSVAALNVSPDSDDESELDYYKMNSRFMLNKTPANSLAAFDIEDCLSPKAGKRVSPLMHTNSFDMLDLNDQWVSFPRDDPFSLVFGSSPMQTDIPSSPRPRPASMSRVPLNSQQRILLPLQRGPHSISMDSGFSSSNGPSPDSSPCQSVMNTPRGESPVLSPRPVLLPLTIAPTSPHKPTSYLRGVSGEGIASPSYHHSVTQHSALNWTLDDLDQVEEDGMLLRSNSSGSSCSTPRRQNLGCDLTPMSPNKFSSSRGLPPRQQSSVI